MIKFKMKIKVGDMFNAYVKHSSESKTLLGEEGAGRLAFACPEIALKVSDIEIETQNYVYVSRRFTFVKVK